MILPRNISDWPEDWQFQFNERSAIIEFLANRPREEAERTAEAAIRKMAMEESWSHLT